ncbi:MAG: GNAT family N-acetyltransferase [Prevotella sp.]|nr:GNAT family N-acetyltransferase [Prevotella sp.]
MKQQVTLRAIEPEDLDLLYRIENDMSLWRIGSGNVPYSRFALHEYVERCTNDIYVDKQMRLMIVNEEQVTVGIIDLMDFSPQHRRAEVGIVLMEQYRRQGYGMAALEALIQYAHGVVHLHQLYSIIGVSNQASFALFQKMGFTSQICLKDWLLSEENYEDAHLMQYFF